MEDISIEDLFSDFTDEEALSAIRNARNQSPIGLTARDIAELLGCSVSKVRAELRSYAAAGRLVVRKYSIKSPLDGKLYPTPHYVVKPQEEG